MNTKTAHPASAIFEELYNTLMWDIEPELTTLVLPDLAMLYKGETAEEKQQRFERYSDAMEQFLLRYRDFVAKYKDHLRNVKSDIRALTKKSQQAKDAEHLSSLERSFEQS